MLTMKKQIYLLTLICATLFIAQSLEAQSEGPAFSVVGAVLKSSITGDSDSWKDPFGAQGGIIVEFAKDFVDAMSIRAEANLSMQGAKWEEDYGEGPVKGVTRLLYLNVPLVARYQSEGGFYGELGIQPGLLLSAKDKYEGLTVDYSEYVRKFDFSIPIGVGYEFENSFGIGVRVIPGISNINSSDYADYKDHNLVFALRATYTFRKK